MDSGSNLLFQGEDVNEKYQLLSKIGSGGMGDVFLGVQRGAVDFNRLVVIKQIHSRLFQRGGSMQEEHARMFINEASLVASLNHPHIVKIYDFCRTKTSVAIVMEYIEGETLRFIRSSCAKHNIPLPLPIAFRMILDACDALNYAHDFTTHTGEPHQIIHRDIGLHNLMLDSNGYLKVIDFGIAKSNFPGKESAPGLIKGNPSYIAPDLFTQKKPDHRVDIYALGLSLYELITLQKALRFEPGVDFAMIVQHVTSAEIPPPSTIVPDLPSGLDEVIAKAIHKNREQRYQTVEAFGEDLRAISEAVDRDDFNLKKWFNQNFENRLQQRRDFGAKMSALAKRANESSGAFSINPNITNTGMSSVSSLVRSPSSVSNVAPPPIPGKTVGSSGTMTSFVEALDPSNLYKILTGLFLFFAGCAVVLYLLFFKEPAAVEVQPELTDNLVVECELPGAMLSVNGRDIGLIGNEGISLRIEPNQKHNIVVSKKGYRDYSLPFIGPAMGAKLIRARLIPIEEEPSPVVGDGSSTAPTDKAEEMVFPGGTEAPRPAPVAAPGPAQRKVWVKKDSSQAAPGGEAASSAAEEKAKDSAVEETGKRKVPLPDDTRSRVPILDDEKDKNKGAGRVPLL